MGTFIGHIVPGLAFFLLGLWHLFNNIKAYKLRGHSSFESRHWYPFNTPLCTIKHLELLLIFSFSIFAIAIQILDYPLLQFTFKPNNFEHAAMFLHLAIYACSALAAELTRSPNVLSGIVGVLASSVFGQELLLLHFHSADHSGLEGHYHLLLQLIVLASLLSAMAAAGFPSSFSAAIIRSMSVMFQGCWFMDMGFMLWVPNLVPKGCFATLGEDPKMFGAVICGTEEANLRAMALANLQFSWILAGILIFTVILCLTSAEKCTHSNVSNEYEKLHNSRTLDLGQIVREADGHKQLHP
ncbi:transmembrane epididymal protein (DUF716) [Tasmannia lanceolata]|uniref:transmembrane epididymal protein (DUF716) n=1 Tax=Tasmannia lanceolata TaxID=3420 RepID=UPI004062CE3D